MLVSLSIDADLRPLDYGKIAGDDSLKSSISISMPDIEALRTTLDELADDPLLLDEAYFSERVEALDLLEWLLIELEAALADHAEREHVAAVIDHAHGVQTHLQQVNERLFQRLQAAIRTQAYTGPELMAELRRYAPGTPGTTTDGQYLYDSLDILVNGILGLQLPEQTEVALEPEMVMYQPTPARIILDMIEQTGVGSQGIFFDLGSGLGHVPILVALISGARACGVEIDPGYCAVARACAKRLSIENVEFLCQDARAADFSQATIFYLYTPFRGAILHTVLEKLHTEAQKRPISIYICGPYLKAAIEDPRYTAFHQVEGTGEVAIFRSKS